MPKVLFVFAGTGDVATNIHNTYESEPFNDDVVRVYFNGCQDSQIGGAHLGLGFLSPNLDTVAGTIRTCFAKDGSLSLHKLHKKFGNAIIIEPTTHAPNVEVNSIDMVGFSRGGVTTFAVARHLDDIGKPMSLYADDPVPGNSKSEAKENSSEFYKNHDLRHCANLKHAEVSIGAYKNNVNPLHNKFFRQMAPLFSKECDASIYVVPKTHHLHDSNKADNQRIDFLAQRGLVTSPNYYEETKDRMTFTPKVIQQKTHRGVTGRTEISPRFKAQLHELVSQTHTLDSAQSFKITQALHALDLGPSTTSKDGLYQTVKEDRTPKGKAIREFLVEFEAINNYAFRKSQTDTTKAAMNNYRAKIYEQLSSFPVDHSTPEQQTKFSNTMLMNLKAIQGKIPGNEYKELNRLVSSFLKDNVLFHPDQTQYLDETETHKTKPTVLKDADSAMISVKTARNGNELAEVLYHMSKNSRDEAYKQFPKELHKVIKDAQQLEKVIRFLPAKDIESMLQKPEMKEHIQEMSQLNSIIDKLPRADQKIVVFQAMKNDIKDLNPTFKQLGELIQHLPIDKCKSLFKSLPLAKVDSKSSADMIHLFEQMDKKQFNKLLPIMAKDIHHYLSKRIGKDDGNDLQTYLQSRAESSESKKALKSIFPEKSALLTAQQKLKSQLTSIISEANPAVEASMSLKIR